MASANLRRAALQTLLSLPSPIVRLLAGGGAVWRGGRTLDPRLQLLAAFSRGAPAINLLPPEDARRVTAHGLQFVCGRPEKGVEVEPHILPGPRGEIAARLYKPPRQADPLPVMVFAHFGGGIIGGVESSEVFCSLLAKAAGCPVLAVDYAGAPEHRFPAALEDMLAAFRWARANAERFGAPPGLAAIGGESIGGNLAAVAAQELKRLGEPQPVLQLLLYPGVDLASEAASMTTYAEAFPLSRALLDWFVDHYLGPEADPADPRLSPLRAKDLSGLAPAVIAAAGFDPLVDQGEAYARALRDAGVDVAYRCYDSLAHGFAAFTGAVPAADAACRQIAALVRGKLEDAML
jgi:acetyl esterase/lipase